MKVSDVTQVVTHPDYSSSTKANNIALWKLSSPVSTETYTRMCLPAQDSTAAGDVKLVGWRISEVVGSLSQSLQETSTSLVSASECGAGSDIVCTGTNTRCQGDVGAPLVQEYKLVGVMSGHGCCSTSQYGQFTNIAKYTSWISSKVTDVCVL